jgi:ATP-dependent helicase HrpB
MVTDVVDPLVRLDDVVEWDPRRRDVAAERRTHLGAITVSSEPLADPDRDAVTRALLVGIRTHGLGLLGQLGRTDDLRRRVGWLRAVRPDDGWPDWSDPALLADLELWLAPFLGRVRRAADLGRVDVRAALLAQMDWAQQRAIDESAPTHWTTASGRRVTLRYGEVDGEPGTVVAAVALRDVIGTDAQPTVGASGVPITLELLSPAGRPLQRTADLPGFWRGSYAEVRAEMRGRYPKHPWPERPWEPLPPRRRR